MALQAPSELLGIHTNMLPPFRPTLQRHFSSAARRHPVSQPTNGTRTISWTFFNKRGLGYAIEMANRPQRLYGIADSPIALAAWILDHDARSYALISRVFDGHSAGLTRDDILDNITLYWLLGKQAGFLRPPDSESGPNGGS